MSSEAEKPDSKSPPTSEPNLLTLIYNVVRDLVKPKQSTVRDLEELKKTYSEQNVIRGTTTQQSPTTKELTGAEIVKKLETIRNNNKQKQRGTNIKNNDDDIDKKLICTQSTQQLIKDWEKLNPEPEKKVEGPGGNILKALQKIKNNPDLKTTISNKYIQELKEKQKKKSKP